MTTIIITTETFGAILWRHRDNFARSVSIVAEILAAVPFGKERDAAFLLYKDCGPLERHITAVKAEINTIDAAVAVEN
ncbi:hypothetical protein ACFL0C_01845 [Patescibacteria group bacterium]